MAQIFEVPTRKQLKCGCFVSVSGTRIEPTLFFRPLASIAWLIRLKIRSPEECIVSIGIPSLFKSSKTISPNGIDIFSCVLLGIVALQGGENDLPRSQALLQVLPVWPLSLLS
jgi:hypothetical protein